MAQTNLRRFVRRRLINVGVKPTAARDISDRFQVQLAHMGIEGACTYFKRVGDQLMAYLYGSPERTEWVATTRSGFPKFLIGLRDERDHEVLIRVAKFARVLRLESPSAKQIAKVIPAVVNTYGGTSFGLDRVCELITRGAQHYALDQLGKFPTVSSDRLHNHYTDTLTVSAPIMSYQTGTSVPPLLDSLSIIGNNPVLQVPGFEHVFWPMSPVSVRELVQRLVIEPMSSPVGEIHATQVGGCKLRMFAAPYTIVQCLLSPIHEFVDQARRRIPMDCTYDQLSGARAAQSVLRQGRKVWSFDLTTATCRFPLFPQLQLLRFLGVPDSYIQALHWACRGDWKVGTELKGFPKSLAWKTGQPLGLRPSMSMFSTSHDLLLTGLCLEHDLVPEDSFVTLGDDVMIFEEALASSYQVILGEIDVPISIAKSHISNKVAEFAGATITSDLIVRPGQWRQLDFFNCVSYALELKRPLVGESTSLALRAQKVALFINGLYDPLVEEWPWYIKAATMVSMSQYDLPKVPKAPSLIDGAYSLYSSIVSDLYPDYFCRFESSQESFTTAAFRPLLEEGLDVEPFIGFSDEALDGQAFCFGARPAHIEADQAIGYAQSFVEMEYNSGTISSTLRARLNSAIYAEVTSLLFVPPKKTSETRALREQIERLFRAANPDKANEDYPHDIFIVSDSDGAIPAGIVSMFLERRRAHELFMRS